MAILVHDCPHCGCKKAAFTISYAAQVTPNKNEAIWNFFSACPNCFGPIAGVIECTPDDGNPKSYYSDISKIATSLMVFPEMPPSKSPEHVPEAAARAFIEGADSLKDGRYNAAVSMFRRAIDVGTKEFCPEIDVFKLEKRIDKLANEGLITKALQEWAHKIRLEGNEALHAFDSPTKEQATELQLFTELVLTYLFTLPAKVKANIRSE